ncbi:MAG TPA: PilZ domain-containing protein [Candidatus Angelobacter sp.]
MGTAQMQYAANRRYPRYICELGIEVRVANSETGYWGTVADICLGGCYVNTFSPLPAGTPVMLLINTKVNTIAITGNTITFHPGLGMGIEFVGFATPDAEVALKALINDLALAQNQ